MVREGVGTGIYVYQHENIEIRRVYIEQPVLTLIRHGTKKLSLSGGEYLIRQGEAVAVAGRQSVDVVNRAGAGGRHCSSSIAFDSSLIASHAETNAGRPEIGSALHIPAVSPALVRSFDTALNAIADKTVPLRIARHQASELLLWLSESGACFRPEKEPTLNVRIRRHIENNAAMEWNAATIAAAFAMSEATLRRKLASENTSVVEIVTDIRMSSALKLLQSTTQSVNRIAQLVGYESPSHFSMIFKQRFGFSPTTLRDRER